MSSENKDDKDFKIEDQKFPVCKMMKNKNHDKKEHTLDAGGRVL